MEFLRKERRHNSIGPGKSENELFVALVHQDIILKVNEGNEEEGKSQRDAGDLGEGCLVALPEGFGGIKYLS